METKDREPDNQRFKEPVYFKSKDSLLVPFTKKGEKYGQKDFS